MNSEDNPNSGNTSDHNNDFDDQLKQEKRDGFTAKKYLIVIFKIVIIVTILGIALYLIYTESQVKKALFYLSDNEIIDIKKFSSINRLNIGNKLYFFIQHAGKDLEADSVSIEIELFTKSDYTHYKQITYEIDKKYPYMNGYISEVFFKQEGKYRVKLYLDNNLTETHEILVSKGK